MGMAVHSGDKSKRGGPGPSINITPLVDVALVVLIIFMVVAPMLTKTFTLNVPPEPEKDKPPPAQSDEPLVMTIDETGAMKINKQPITAEELPEKLPAMLAGRKHKVLHFDAADGLPYGDVVATLDRCRDAGAQSIAVVTKKLETP